MNKIHIYKIIVLCLLAAMLFAFNNCMPKVPGQGGGGPSSSGRTPSSSPVEGPAPQTEEQVLNSIQVEVGVKNFEQILHTMSELTGVDSQNAGIKTVYTEVVSSLPTENDAKVFMASHQVAITKLAAEYCQVLIENATLRAAIWPSFNFTLRPNQNAFSETSKLYFVDTAINAFWIVASEQEKAMARSQLVPLIDELLVNENLTISTTTRSISKAVCTSVLASIQVNLL